MAVKPATKPKAEKVEVVTIKHIAAHIAENHGLTKKQTNEIFDEFVAAVVKNLKKGARIRMSGIGILQVRKRAAGGFRPPAFSLKACHRGFDMKALSRISSLSCVSCKIAAPLCPTAF